MLHAAYPALRPGGIMLAHNIMLQNTTDSEYIENKVNWNQGMFTKFLPFVDKYFSTFSSFETTEGLGVANK